MVSYHNINYSLAQIRPKHHYDTISWSVWPKDPDTVVKHGDVLFKWTYKKTRRSRVATFQISSLQSDFEVFAVTKLFSLDEGLSWQEDTFTTEYRWSKSPEKKPMEAMLDDAIAAGKIKEQRRRSREKARARAALLKKQAETEGITVTELRKRLSTKRKQENPHKVSKKDIEQLQRKIAIGSTLKELQDEITLVMEKLDSNSIKITHVDRYTSKLEKAIQILREWQK